MHRRFVAGLAGLGAVALLAGPALAGNASGGGAQRSPLFVVDQNMDCSQSSSPGAPVGFVILNSTKKPGDAGNVLGEVSLKNADPGATYTVNLQSVGSSSGCVPVSSVTTNAQGNGNGHIPSPPTAVIADTAGVHQYYVVLQEMTPKPTATKTQLQSNVLSLD